MFFILSFFGVVVVVVVVWFCLKVLSYRNSKNPVLFFLKIWDLWDMRDICENFVNFLFQFHQLSIFT